MNSIKFLIICTLSLIMVLSMAAFVSADTVELDYMTFVTAHADYYKIKAEEFDQAHPEFDFVLNAQTLEYQQMHDKLNISLQTSMGLPDIVDVEIAKFPGIVANGYSQMVDLTPLAKKYEESVLFSRFAPYSFEEKVYGIPTHVGTVVMYYNKAVMDEAGVNIDEIKTWQDYIEAGKKVTKDLDGDGTIDQYMLPVETTDRLMFHAIARQFGSDAFDKEGNVVLDRPENIRVLQMIQDMVYEQKIANPVSQYNDNNFYTAMNNGMYASLPYPQWYMIRFTEFMPDLSGDIVVRPLPAFEESGTTLSNTGGGTGTVITKACDNIEIAQEFLEFAKLTKKANISIWTTFGLDPFRQDVYEEPELNQPVEYFNNEVVLQTIKSLFPEIQPLYLTPQFPLSEDIIREEVMFNVIEQQMDPAEVLKAAADQIREEMN